MIYLLWTGGFDSTWRLLHLVMIQQKPVTPIYLTGKIDHLISGGRQTCELDIIYSLLREIQKHIPRHNYCFIQPLVCIDIEEMFPSPYVLTVCRDLYLQKRLHRPICQFTYLLTIAESSAYQSDIVEAGYLGTDCLLRSFPTSNIGKLQLPLYCYGKGELWSYANKYKWSSILHSTVSCWYFKHQKACGTCSMCKNRIRAYQAYQKKTQLHQELFTLFA